MAFGDEYLGFWAQRSYNIVVNTSLFNDPSRALHIYKKQLTWLEDRLEYAQLNDATHVFVYSHHPWFLYNENETGEDYKGFSSLHDAFVVPDSYFHVPLEYRKHAMDLFRKYKVTAAFAGHFHQNVISKTTFGMSMIITAPLSRILRSNGVPEHCRGERTTQGVRLVTARADGTYEHAFQPLLEKD